MHDVEEVVAHNEARHRPLGQGISERQPGRWAQHLGVHPANDDGNKLVLRLRTGQNVSI
jgi:hypothetical protein